jgi:hypothetical protein
MDAFVLVWDKREKKPKVARAKIHASTANVYIVKVNDYTFEKQYQNVRIENVFFDRNEAQCEIQLEIAEIIRRRKFITITEMPNNV